LGDTREAVDGNRWPGSRILAVVVILIGIGAVASLYTCMMTGGMDVHIENETAELYDTWLRTTCDVINYGDPGNVTISVYVHQDGQQVDSCEQEIHLNRNEVKDLFFYPEIDPEAGEYTYEFKASNEKPD
jgi:hypothetical protein